MNDRIQKPFTHYLDVKSFAQCRDCLVPMLGILSYDAREFCYDCTQEHKRGLDLTLCRGL